MSHISNSFTSSSLSRAIMDKKKIKTSRSRTGCYTCRKRKKKCDELSYPRCQNCLSKNLECVWPALKHELHKKLEQVKYITSDTDGSQNSKSAPHSTAIRHHPATNLPTPTPDTPFFPQKPSKKQSYFLERIAMQQDCVDEEEDDGFSQASTASVSPLAISKEAPVFTTQTNGRTKSHLQSHTNPYGNPESLRSSQVSAAVSRERVPITLFEDVESFNPAMLQTPGADPFEALNTLDSLDSSVSFLYDKEFTSPTPE